MNLATVESRLKRKIEVWSNSSNPMTGAVARTLRALGYVRRFVLNPRIRWEQMTRLRFGTRQYQGATATSSNGYPELFRACAQHLQHVRSPVLLSFGCSTGEEPFSLAEYLPNASIVGVDINPWCLRECRRTNHNSRIRFLHTMSPEFARLEGLDAILCIAVFQRTENRTRPAPVAQGGFTFLKFEEEIDRLDRKLKVGGLFFIDHADFRFEDTAAAFRYSALDFEGNEAKRQRPLFGRDNRLVAQEYVQPRAFVKTA